MLLSVKAKLSSDQAAMCRVPIGAHGSSTPTAEATLKLLSAQLTSKAKPETLQLSLCQAAGCEKLYLWSVSPGMYKPQTYGLARNALADALRPTAPCWGDVLVQGDDEDAIVAAVKRGEANVGK